MVLVLCISSDDALYLYKDSRKYLKGFLRAIQRTRFLIFKFSKENNSVKNVGGVMVHFFCLLSDDVLYLYKVS